MDIAVSAGGGTGGAFFPKSDRSLPETDEPVVGSLAALVERFITKGLRNQGIKNTAGVMKWSLVQNLAPVKTLDAPGGLFAWKDNVERLLQDRVDMGT